MSKERLVELINSYPCMSTAEDNFMESIADDLADYILAGGGIVPPCKVGDKVFVICNDEVQETSVLSMKIDISDDVSDYLIFAYAVDGTEKAKDGYYVPYVIGFRFGVRAFSSREEAEEKLRSESNA